jgi:hypothetical protein
MDPNTLMDLNALREFVQLGTNANIPLVEGASWARVDRPKEGPVWVLGFPATALTLPVFVAVRTPQELRLVCEHETEAFASLLWQVLLNSFVLCEGLRVKGEEEEMEEVMQAATQTVDTLVGLIHTLTSFSAEIGEQYPPESPKGGAV